MPDIDFYLLALDGGVVRRLPALIFLEQLMETIDRETPPKPCDYFDMIGRTSTIGNSVLLTINTEDQLGH
jgi:patatin-like phospholipase/acyl hydrolase